MHFIPYNKSILPKLIKAKGGDRTISLDCCGNGGSPSRYKGGLSTSSISTCFGMMANHFENCGRPPKTRLRVTKLPQNMFMEWFRPRTLMGGINKIKKKKRF
jgi:hypothetical protein